MTIGRIAAAALVAWLVSIPLGAAIHHGLLGNVYAADTGAFRPDSEIVRRLPIGFAASLIGFVSAAALFARGRAPSGGLAAGLLFGAQLSLIIVSFAVVWTYVTQPIAIRTGVAMAFECVFGSTIYGGIIGLFCRHTSNARSGHARQIGVS